MPIRHCQKCGLRVLIDESQSTRNPFFCQRCAASEKEEGSKATATAEAPAAKSTGPVKVACPYCKASFTGKVPTKPAKGACPVGS